MELTGWYVIVPLAVMSLLMTRYGRRKQSERPAAPLRRTALVDPLRTQG